MDPSLSSHKSWYDGGISHDMSKLISTTFVGICTTILCIKPTPDYISEDSSPGLSFSHGRSDSEEIGSATVISFCCNASTLHRRRFKQGDASGYINNNAESDFADGSRDRKQIERSAEQKTKNISRRRRSEIRARRQTEERRRRTKSTLRTTEAFVTQHNR